MSEANTGVLIIYSGGTIGSVPGDRKDPNSPLEPAPSVDEVLKWLPRYDAADRKIVLAGKSVRIGTKAIAPPIDSSNLEPDHWLQMATLIRESYADYEGFVLLHGTDTLAYTASALAFMFENLSKPVVVTGSQLPIGQTRSDATQNLVTSIEIAAAKSLGRDAIPEVCVFFRDHLFRGCRVTKTSASSFNAFSSPNMKELGVAGEHIKIDTSLSHKPSNQHLHVKTRLERGVAVLNLFPGIRPELLESILQSPDLRGVVLRTYGTGNAPSNSAFLDVIEKAVRRGTLVVDVTQCVQGEVELGNYEVSAGLLARGVISGMDMTTEAALCKMFVLLGEHPTSDTESSRRHAEDMMQLNLRGEQRQSIFHLHFPAGRFSDETEELVQTITPLAPMVAGLERFRPDTVDRAILRITGLSIPNAKRGIIQFRVFLDDPAANASSATENNPSFVGEAVKKWAGEDEAVFLDVTTHVRKFVDNRHENTLTIVNDGQAFSWKRADLACFAP